MNLLIRVLVVSLVILVSELYFYRLLNILFIKNEKKKTILKFFVISFAVLFILFEGGCYLIVGAPLDDPVKYRQLFLPLSAFILVYIPKAAAALVLMIYDISRFSVSFFRRKKAIGKTKKQGLTIYVAASLLMIIVLAFCIDGFVFEKTRIKIQKEEFYFRQLPAGFDGFRIVQISDLHLGTFTNDAIVKEYLKTIRELAPDMLVMTGDMINVTDTELLPYEEDFKAINPPYGKFAILGNHDIGDYFKMKDPPNLEAITANIIRREKETGFHVLIDSACHIYKNGDSITLIGVNNFGMFPFKKTGNLKKALSYTSPNDFKILLSHDPNHWSMEVKDKTNIQMTLSGHTHAMQIAIITKFFRFSPSQFINKYWYGAYGSVNQKLYVNPGLGYSGFHGRIGSRPEITVIVLHRTK